MELLHYDIGKGLLKLRKEKGFSAKELYTGLCDRSTYRKIENGEVKTPAFQLIMSFCSRMGVGSEMLLRYSRPIKIEKTLNWIEYAENLFSELKIDVLTTNLPRYSDLELQILKKELPTKDYQRFILLYFMSYFFSENKFYTNEEIIVYFEDALSLTYKSKSTVLTASEVAIVNNLLNLTNLDINYFELALKYADLIEINVHDLNSRSKLIINNAIAYYLYYKKEWDKLFDHSSTFLASYGKNTNFAFIQPFNYFIGISMYKLGRRKDGIIKIREAMLSIKIVGHDVEYKVFQQMAADDDVPIELFDNIDYYKILTDFEL